MTVPHTAAALLGLAWLGGAALSAQPAPPTPVARAQAVETAPVIDGRLDDPEWASAPVVADFRQKEPGEGEPASEATRVRLVYTRTHLYIGVELADSDPAGIRATELKRDNELEADDSFSVLLDTYHDHRNGFLFRVNPRGTRYDAVVRNESSEDEDWDEQWIAAAVITDTGWTAEMAIPFKILRFSGDREQRWGLNFARIIRRKNEEAYWTNWSRDFEFIHVSQAGHLAGVTDIVQAERLRIRPYVVAGVERLDASDEPPGARGIRDVGLDDVKIAVTSTLTADLTVNPDFAQTEADEQQVNLTRFSLFFPEKRQFFIEGSDSLMMAVAQEGYHGSPPLELFYSRRVGLSRAGSPVPIIAGGKLTGKVGGFDVGVLNVQTDSASGLPGENFGVARFRRELFGRSYVGAIATSRRGDGAWNQVVGADARFVVRDHLTLTGLLAAEDAQGRGATQWARHGSAAWEDDLVSASASYVDIDAEFDPAVGYVRRRDRMVSSSFNLKPRPGGGPIRQFEIGPSVTVYHDHAGVLRTRDIEFSLEAALQSGDSIDLSFGNSVDHPEEPFEIAEGVVLPSARYEWNTFGARVWTSSGRPVSVGVEAEAGGFYGGTRRTVALEADLRPNAHLSISPGYEFNDVALAEGAFDTHLVGLRTSVAFGTSAATSVYFQYNSEGQLAAVQVRFNYIFRTIDNLYVVYNGTRFTDGPFSGRDNQSLVVKVTYSVHR